MNESYHEYMIKRETSLQDYLLRILFCLICTVPAAFIILGAGTIVSVIALLLEIAVVYVTIIVFRNTDVEFEYIYMSGELQFDKICGKAKRKGCGKLELEKVEIVAHESAKELEKFEKEPYKLRDFSTRLPEESRYVAFQRNNTTLIKVVFDPNEDIIKSMKDYSPRKVLRKGEQGYF